ITLQNMVLQLVFMVISFALAEGSCPNLFDDIGNCCFYFSHDHGMGTNGITETWSRARNYCHDLGELLGETIDLAEVGTSHGQCTEDFELMQIIGSKVSTTWLGASDQDSEGEWVWQHSKETFPLSSNMWECTHPSGGTDHNCLATIANGTHHRAYLYDGRCTNYWHFVCQIF
ncbi:unnamed protein product, partial [Meganyctiphanes norvegica]